MAGAKEQTQYEKQINYLKDALRRSRDLRERALSQKELNDQIASLKEEMDRLLKETKELIPWDLLEKERSR